MRNRDLAICLTSVFACLVCSGCNLIPKADDAELPAAAVESSADHYYVEMHKGFGEAKVFKGTIDKPTTVQNALEQSGAQKQFAAMSVDVMRQLPNGTVLKLPVEFKSGKKVKYEQDYALHPEDRIVVKSKSGSALDKLVDNVLGDF